MFAFLLSIYTNIYVKFGLFYLFYELGYFHMDSFVILLQNVVFVGFARGDSVIIYCCRIHFHSVSSISQSYMFIQTTKTYNSILKFHNNPLYQIFHREVYNTNYINT